MPFAIDIEPTTSCNLRCPECPSGLRNFNRPTGMLQDNFFQKTIDSVSSYVSYLTFYFQGEPYLNPSFLDMVKYANQKGIYTTTSTNAHYLNDEKSKQTIEAGLDRLIISLDGATQEVFEKYRVGGQIEKVIEGAKNIVNWKKELKSSTPHVIIQVIASAHNEHQIDAIKKLGKEIGVDEVRIKTMQIYDYEEGSEFFTKDNSLSRYRINQEGQYVIKNDMPNECWRLWHSTVITWDGKVIPCCFDKDANHQFGSLQEKDLREIWRNDAYQNYRNIVLNDRKSIEICRNCSEGCKVWD